jgi:hypothetical protein
MTEGEEEAALWSKDSPFRCGRPACLCACESTDGKLRCNDDGCAHWRCYPGRHRDVWQPVRPPPSTVAYFALALGIMVMVAGMIVTLIGRLR